jgi:uncharacterized protein (DUF2345 family)
LVSMAAALSLLGLFFLLRQAFSDRAKHQRAQQMVGAASYYASKQKDLDGAALLLQSDLVASGAGTGLGAGPDGCRADTRRGCRPGIALTAPAGRCASPHPSARFHPGTNTHAKPRLSDVVAGDAAA